MSVFVPGYTRSNGTTVKAYTKKKKRLVRKSNSRKATKRRLSPAQIRLLKARETSKIKRRRR